MTIVNSLYQNQLVRGQLRTLQEEMARLERQMASGRKAERFSELGGSDTRRVAVLKDARTALDGYDTTLSRLNFRLTQVDLNLNDIQTVTADIFSQTIDSDLLGEKPAQLKRAATDAIARVIDRLNASADGARLFAGVETATQPVRDADSMMTELQAAIGALTPPNDGDPAAVAQVVSDYFADTANWYQGGVAMQPVRVDESQELDASVTAADPAFAQVLSGLFMAALVTPDQFTDSTDYRGYINGAGALMSQGNQQVRERIASNGDQQSFAEDIQDLHGRARTLLDEQEDDLLGVDLAALITRVTALQTQLQASYQLTGQLRNLSLVNFI